MGWFSAQKSWQPAASSNGAIASLERNAEGGAPPRWAASEALALFLARRTGPPISAAPSEPSSTLGPLTASGRSCLGPTLWGGTDSLKTVLPAYAAAPPRIMNRHIVETTFAYVSLARALSSTGVSSPGPAPSRLVA